MVFHSYTFILVFLPAVYAAFVLAHRVAGWPGAFRLLVVASLAFYAQWSLALLAILLISATANFALGELLMRLSQDRNAAKIVLFAGVAANLGSLGYFKYTNFLIDTANQIAGTGYGHVALIVPVGVSFFTFIQVCYLMEAYNGHVERPTYGNYLLFATFFPCVTAGPLVLQREMLGQMRNRTDAAFDSRRLAVGLTLFGMGLFKKVVLADGIGPYADTVFNGVAAGQGLSPLVAWLGALCYALQLYFDFSGYSDMAIGLGFMFGLKLPINFDSPFKATNISDFWRRWHVTMTRIFTNFIFTPLAMNGMRKALVGRYGLPRRFLMTAAVPAIVTFLVAGVWHGAGWSFAIYGVIHGVAIATNLCWREFSPIRLPDWLGWGLTMAVVVSALVVFRAPDLSSAGLILSGMWGASHLLTMPDALVAIAVDRAASLVVLLGAIVLLLPNTQQILHRDWVSCDAQPTTLGPAAGFVVWRPDLTGAIATATAFCAAFAMIGGASTFLYYQF